MERFFKADRADIIKDSAFPHIAEEFKGDGIVILGITRAEMQHAEKISRKLEKLFRKEILIGFVMLGNDPFYFLYDPERFTPEEASDIIIRFEDPNSQNNAV